MILYYGFLVLCFCLVYNTGRIINILLIFYLEIVLVLSIIYFVNIKNFKNIEYMCIFFI